MPFNNSPRLLKIRLLSYLSHLQLVAPTLLSAVHWSPIKYRIDFKILLFVYNALNNLAPQYLTFVHTPHLEHWGLVISVYSSA